MAPVVVNQKNVRSFTNEAEFEAWLAKHHASATEIWLRIYKKGSGVPTISVAQALDVVLCWGWIDGIRKGLDESSFLQRYTPRKSRSVWSQINRDHVARLVAAGRMTPHGQVQVDRAKADGRWDAAYAPMRSASIETLPADLRAAIEAHPQAAATLQKLGRPNLFALVFRVSAMKTPAGRARKIAELVTQLASGKTILPQPKLAEPSATQAPPAAKPPAAKARTRAGHTRATGAAKSAATRSPAPKTRVTKTRASKTRASR